MIFMDSKQIHKALREMYAVAGDGSAYIEEFRAGTGYQPGSERYLDAWVIGCYPSSGMVKTAIEVKISRSDFAREIKQPKKRDSALRISNLFYFAAPKGLIAEKDLPDECGLIEVDALTGKAAVTVEAPYRETCVPSWVFVASLARRAAKSSNAEVSDGGPLTHESPAAQSRRSLH
jgi:hypothetical protein